MKNHSENPYIGLSINPDKICLVLMKNKSVQNLISKNLIQSFDMETMISQDNFLDTQSDILSELQQNIGTGNEVGISLYSGCVLIKRIPVALGLDKDFVKDQLYWEAQQFTISSLKDYIIDYQRLPFQTLSGNPLYIVVLIRKKILSMIRKLVENTGMVLKDVDVDVFSNIRSLIENYQLNEEINILIDVQREYICFIFIKDEEFFLSNTISLKKNDGSVIVDISEINDFLIKELKRLIFGHKIINKIEDFDTIFLTGSESVYDLKDKLADQLQVPIEILNPFAKIKVVQSVSSKDVFQKHPEKFVSSIGVALKKFK